MFAIVLGMLIVVCGVLFLRLHAFLALFFATLVVAAATTAHCVYDSAIDNQTAQVAAASNQQLELIGVGDQFGAKPGAYYLVRDDDDIAKLETTSVWVEKFEATDNGTTAILRDGLSDSGSSIGTLLISQTAYDKAVQLAKTSPTNRVANALGDTFGKIGVLIAMASIIGQCLLQSGAAERIVQSIRESLGEKWTALAFVISSFILAIPVFFDTVFFLMLPLAQAMAQRTGRDYLKYVMSIIVGGTLAHSLVPPTPGPLFVASELNVSIGAMAIGGIAVGVWGVIAGYFYMIWANRRWIIPLRVHNSSADAAPTQASQLPSFGLSILPVVVPIFLLAMKTVNQTWMSDLSSPLMPIWNTAISFLGDKNVALSLGAVLAMLTLILKPDMTWVELGKSVQKALGEGGVVILITCAGGAFGEMIRQTNVGASIADSLPASVSGTGLLAMAFFVTMIIRVIQGSATVAMIAAIGIVVPVATQIGLPFHPVYLALAIGCGSKPLPWMNDSGFWVISRMSGFTEQETLKTFSVLLTIMGFVSFLATVVCALCFPLV
ncbi:GntP family permease [Blastopirellula sp. JC732]|uniref:GntP family permease n=1 Tax=Blastopirellula sediminis TaxID=2894196 RepID=A0A9X1MKN7_9BACT|nr:SLC13 family permease [Blastopirellula sediminis]MCC9608627.1 GntP family permease [Blastopirellula sediminis]MCC9628596.1 GntP family permease [Blastopirellula sediminis]